MKKGEKGFTLTELMVVLAIVGILAGISTMTVLDAAADYHLKAAARDLSSLLRQARAQAIKYKRPVSISFELKEYCAKTDGCYVLDKERGCPRTLPQGGSIRSRYGGGVHFGFGAAKKGASSSGRLPAAPVSFQGRKIRFNSMGLCTAGYVYLANEKGSAIAIGANSTGVIKYKRWNGSAWK